MKKSVIQKVMLMKKAFLLPALCIAALFVLALTGSAASPVPTCQKEMTVYKSVWDEYDESLTLVEDMDPLKISNLAESAVVTNVTSSNPKVATAEFTDVMGFENGMDVTYKAIAIHPQISGKKVRTGSATISFTVKQYGKAYKLSCLYTVKAEPVPFKLFKINGRNYVPEMKDYYNIHVNANESSRIEYKFTKAAENKYKICYENKKGRRVQLKSDDTIKVSAQEVLTLTVEPKVVPEGSWHSCRELVLVRSPFEAFKVNKKDYAALVGTNYGILSGKKAEIKFRVKADVENLEITYTKPSGKTVTVNNNSKISVPKGGLELHLSYRFAGDKEKVETAVFLDR